MPPNPNSEIPNPNIKRLIGVDEAGYGPNLGPLVVAATVWELPEEIDGNDLWSAFTGIISDRPCRAGRTIHIADSKQVHSSSAGIGPLERSALAILELAGQRRDTFGELWDELHDGNERHASREPWFRDGNGSIPASIDFGSLDGLVIQWKEQCQTQRCRLVRSVADLVIAERFNRSVARTGTKGRVLSETTLQLIRRVWDPADDTPTLVQCDKHGGRDRYAELLADIFPEIMPIAIEETRTCSRYRVGRAEFQFRARSEDRLPVAAASIIAKYLRELSMDLFNAYWLKEIPDLKPTRGYPVDARRFLEAISGRAEELEIERDWYWRSR